MLNTSKRIITALILASVGSAYAAQPGEDRPAPPPPHGPAFKHSFPVTRSDFLAEASKRFDKLDINKNGQISEDEFYQGRPRREDRPHRRPGSEGASSRESFDTREGPFAR